MFLTSASLKSGHTRFSSLTSLYLPLWCGFNFLFAAELFLLNHREIAVCIIHGILFYLLTFLRHLRVTEDLFCTSTLWLFSPDSPLTPLLFLTAFLQWAALDMTASNHCLLRFPLCVDLLECGLHLVTCLEWTEYGKSDGISPLQWGYKRHNFCLTGIPSVLLCVHLCWSMLEMSLWQGTESILQPATPEELQPSFQCT